ncbi:MAG: sugar phosphate isomerase/epimerase [Oscillospiraceae bacterium]|nr:sugar phosphate isomerase/epimerase [Oscillospiraceae bacterium]
MKVALQFFSVRNALKADPVGTMRKVAAMGYRYWEVCAFNPDSPYNYGLDLPVEEGKSLLQELGVKVIGSHIGEADMEDDGYLTKFFDYQAAIGCENPGVAAIFARDRDEILVKCGLMNKCGRMCRERGMRFHYHTHFHDYQLFDGSRMIDLIMENTDPELMDLEVDTFWTVRGGVDPVEMIRQYAGRIVFLHQKDLSESALFRKNLWDGTIDPAIPVPGWQSFAGLEDDFVEVGTGVLPIQDYIDAGNAAGIPYIILEQDYTKLSELESVQESMNAFRKFHGVEWD